MNNYDFVTKVLGMREKTAVQCASDWGVLEPVKKKTKIFTEGGRVEHIVLSVEGVFRAYVVNEEDCEVTDCLVNEPGMSLMPGFDLEMPAPASVEALTNGMIFRLRMADFRKMVDSFPEVRGLYQAMTLRAGQYHLEKGRVLSGCTAEMKYRWFLETHPGMSNQIPDKHIAAFLRMSPVTLSQIKKRMREHESSRI